MERRDFLKGTGALVADGTGTVWIRAGEKAGNVRLIAHHPNLGAQQVEFEIAPEVDFS